MKPLVKHFVTRHKQRNLPAHTSEHLCKILLTISHVGLVPLNVVHTSWASPWVTPEKWKMLAMDRDTIGQDLCGRSPESPSYFQTAPRAYQLTVGRPLCVPRFSEDNDLRTWCPCSQSQGDTGKSQEVFVGLNSWSFSGEGPPAGSGRSLGYNCPPPIGGPEVTGVPVSDTMRTKVDTAPEAGIIRNAGPHRM